jgi:hypothetical protein
MSEEGLRIKAGPVEVDTTGRDLRITILIIILGLLGAYHHHLVSTQHDNNTTFLRRIGDINSIGVCVNALSDSQKQEWLKYGSYCGFPKDEDNRSIRPQLTVDHK